MPKNEGGAFGIFQHPFGRKTPKNEGGPVGEQFFGKKCFTMPIKKIERGPFSLSRYCMLQGKKEKLLILLLGQMVQFDTIKFCRAILVS